MIYAGDEQKTVDLLKTPYIIELLDKELR